MRRQLKKQGGFKNITDHIDSIQSKYNLINFLEESDMPLTKADFDEAIKNINKSVSKDDLSRYD